jgi:predicted nucleotidyltransferase
MDATPDDIEASLRTFFAGRPAGVVAAYLFGSVARGSAKAGSDVDVAILLERPPARTLEGLSLDLAGDLERLLGLPVDLVTLNGAPVDLVHRVLRDGRLVAEFDRAARVAFEVRARSEYFDLLPTLELYRRFAGGHA